VTGAKHAGDQAELPLEAVGEVRDCANPLAGLSAPCKKHKSGRPIPAGRKLRMRTQASVLGFAASVGSLVMRVNSTNVQGEGLRIGGIGRRMNSKVKISQTRRVLRINMVMNLAYSQSVLGRPLLAPIYRWPGLKEPVGFDTYYSVRIRH
jgi:hypothetical protein